MRFLAAGAVGVAVLFVGAGEAAAALPTASTGAAKSVTPSSAVLTGTVNPNNLATTYYFDFGPTKAYGSRTPTQGPTAANKKNVAASASVTGLAPGTTYHFRLVAVNASGTKLGGDRSFKTSSGISLQAAPNPILFGRPVAISGRLFSGTLAGVKVTLREAPFPFRPFKAVATTKTDANGRYSFSRTPGVNTAYQTVAAANPNATSGTLIAQVRVKVTLSLSTGHPKSGDRVRFSGSATPTTGGQLVKLQKRVRGGWRTVKRTTLVSTGALGVSQFSKKVRIRGGGTYRAFVPHDADNASGSAKRKIRLR
jgi:hypothetical protein